MHALDHTDTAVGRGERVVRAVARGLRAYIRHFPAQPGKWLLYRVVNRMTRRFEVDLPAATHFGASLPCRLYEVIQARIYLFGVWEPNLTHFLETRLDEGDAFLDVGANVGYFSLLASKRVGASGLVVAVEASPSTFVKLEENLLRNGASNVRALNVAAARAPGRVRLHAGPRANTGRSTTVEWSRLPVEAEVPAVPLVELIEADQLRRCRIVKIDVEGGELPLLENILDHLECFREDVEFVVEAAPDEIRRSGGCLREVVARFRRAGFAAYRIENDYELGSYLGRLEPRAPRALEAIPAEQVDLVFSRIDAPELLSQRTPVSGRSCRRSLAPR